MNTRSFSQWMSDIQQRTETALDHALSDGEDFELLFAVAVRTNRAVFERAWRARFATRLTCIGRFVRTADLRGWIKKPMDRTLCSKTLLLEGILCGR